MLVGSTSASWPLIPRAAAVNADAPPHDCWSEEPGARPFDRARKEKLTHGGVQQRSLAAGLSPLLRTKGADHNDRSLSDLSLKEKGGR